MNSLKIVGTLRKSREDGIYEGIITTINRDRDGEIVIPMGVINAKDYLKNNPVMFYDHSWIMPNVSAEARLPIGKTLDLTIQKDKIIAKFRFSSLAEKDGEFAQKVKALVDDEILNSFSIGYIPKENVYNPDGIAQLMKENEIDIEQTPNLITSKWEMLEHSIVGIPSNRESVMLNNMAPDKALKIKSFLDYMHSFETKAQDGGAKEPVKQSLSVAEKMASVLKR